MEQHYVVVFGLIGKSTYSSYVSTIICDYPGSPLELVNQIIDVISDDSIKNFGFFIQPSDIVLRSLTKVYECSVNAKKSDSNG